MNQAPKNRASCVFVQSRMYQARVKLPGRMSSPSGYVDTDDDPVSLLGEGP